MPTDYGDDDSRELYIDICTKITAMFTDSTVTRMVILGDFNCQLSSRFYDLFLNLASDNGLSVTDLNRLSDVYTFCSEATSHTSWIDHVLCSHEIDSLVTQCSIFYDFVSSDHKPISVTFENICVLDSSPTMTMSHADSSGLVDCEIISDWSHADDSCLSRYQCVLDTALSGIDIPITDGLDEHTCNKVIEDYYDNVMSCIKDACAKTILTK